MNVHEHDPLGAPPPQQDSAIPAQQRQWAMFAHLSALTGIFTGGLGCILGPLIIWLIHKDDMPFVNDQAKEALNFNITVGIVVLGLLLVGTVLLIILIGFLFYFAAFAVGIYWLVMTVIAAIKSNEGVAYRYPMTLRLVS
ncbi:MAG: DUF4870 domain-containing protein [Lysobacter sp.]